MLRFFKLPRPAQLVTNGFTFGGSSSGEEGVSRVTVQPCNVRYEKVVGYVPWDLAIDGASTLHGGEPGTYIPQNHTFQWRGFLLLNDA
eukprot:scaffold20853_cov56-Attheya_sp.AAC.1